MTQVDDRVTKVLEEMRDAIQSDPLGHKWGGDLIAMAMLIVALNEVRDALMDIKR